MKINLNADLEVTFAPKAFDCVVLAGLKAGGKIEALGLRNGDKVIRVDGEDGATGADIQRMVGESYNKETTTWTVQRGGATLNVTFNGQELSKAMRGGSGAERENFGMRQSIRD
jgi:S1-C subfamily serine protease